MGKTKLLYPLVFAAIFISFLYPIFNPDLFWHLAAARAAAAEGKLLLSREIFSFTRPGADWINYEWLFQWLAYKVYQAGGFRLLVFLRAALLTSIIALLHLYSLPFLPKKGVWPHVGRWASVLFAFVFVSTRGSFQPELFTLLFLVLFFFLRDRILSKKPLYLILFFLLFSVWPNIHGGFVFGIGILGLSLIARLLQWINASPELKPRLRREAVFLCGLILLALAATCLNPYGWRVYEVILEHGKDSASISQLIEEWNPSQFYDRSAWPYLILMAVLISTFLAWGRRRKSLPIEDILIVLAFGYFASSHIRNIALFGVVCLPLFWKYAFSKDLPPAFARGNRILTAGGLCAALVFLGSAAYAQALKIQREDGIMRTHVRGDSYPHRAFYFMELNPFLLKLPCMVEWGWGGYAAWREHENGLRLFFDGRYLFHDLLEESRRVSQNPSDWPAYAERKGIDCHLLKYPKNPGDYRLLRSQARDPKGRVTGYEWLERSWHSQALPAEDWALVWWDHVSLLFVRRSKVPAQWLKEREYKSRFPFDPYWVESEVRKGKIKTQDLVKEIQRNWAETGHNKRNEDLLGIVALWEQKNN